MKRGMQKQIAADAKVSTSFVSLFFSGKKRPSWTTAKRLGAVTGTNPVWWVDGQISKIENVIDPPETLN